MKYKKALQIAAEDAYKSDVVDTEMEEIIIGENGDYSSKEEWITDRLEDWLTRAKEQDNAKS